ncbi:hypothetical protein K438DRAFT_1747136 [Mycena galopus ATCC 62051]|nr:hypothetical protein K438DRAFT_1747136 [Mycena galopus ATCC 62051]
MLVRLDAATNTAKHSRFTSAPQPSSSHAPSPSFQIPSLSHQASRFDSPSGVLSPLPGFANLPTFSPEGFFSPGPSFTPSPSLPVHDPDSSQLKRRHTCYGQSSASVWTADQQAEFGEDLLNLVVAHTHVDTLMLTLPSSHAQHDGKAGTGNELFEIMKSDFNYAWNTYQQRPSAGPSTTQQQPSLGVERESAAQIAGDQSTSNHAEEPKDVAKSNATMYQTIGLRVTGWGLGGVLSESKTGVSEGYSDEQVSVQPCQGTSVVISFPRRVKGERRQDQNNEMMRGALRARVREPGSPARVGPENRWGGICCAVEILPSLYATIRSLYSSISPMCRPWPWFLAERSDIALNEPLRRGSDRVDGGLMGLIGFQAQEELEVLRLILPVITCWKVHYCCLQHIKKLECPI